MRIVRLRIVGTQGSHSSPAVVGTQGSHRQKRVQWHHPRQQVQEIIGSATLVFTWLQIRIHCARIVRRQHQSHRMIQVANGIAIIVGLKIGHLRSCATDVASSELTTHPSTKKMPHLQSESQCPQAFFEKSQILGFQMWRGTLQCLQTHRT